MKVWNDIKLILLQRKMERISVAEAKAVQDLYGGRGGIGMVPTKEERDAVVEKYFWERNKVQKKIDAIWKDEEK